MLLLNYKSVDIFLMNKNVNHDDSSRVDNFNLNVHGKSVEKLLKYRFSRIKNFVNFILQCIELRWLGLGRKKSFGFAKKNQKVWLTLCPQCDCTKDWSVKCSTTPSLPGVVKIKHTRNQLSLRQLEGTLYPINPIYDTYFWNVTNFWRSNTTIWVLSVIMRRGVLTSLLPPSNLCENTKNVRTLFWPKNGSTACSTVE